MRYHNQSSSSDSSWLAIPYDEFDVLVSDIDEAELKKIGEMEEIENLSVGSFSSQAFPVSGIIYGKNLRYMIPLVCQRAKKPNARIVNIWFLVDTSSPFTCLTEKSLESLFGPGNAPPSKVNLTIQDQNSKIECETSKAHFKEVNILGADAMQLLELSIHLNWKKREFRLVKQ